MDRFEKISLAYVFSPAILYLAYMLSFTGRLPFLFHLRRPILGVVPGWIAIFLVIHFIYLKIFLDEVVKRDDSRAWLPLVGIFTLPGIIAYIISRKK